MKTRKVKTPIIVGSTILIFIVLLLFVLPAALNGPIQSAIKAQIDKSLEADVHWGGVRLSLFRNFPNISATVKDLSVSGRKDFAGDTLLKCEEISLTIDIMSLFKKGQAYKITRVFINQPKIEAIVLPSGKANWDIVKPSPPGTASSDPLLLQLKSIEIKKGAILYADFPSKTNVLAQGLNFKGSGDFGKEELIFETQTNIDSLSVMKDNISWLKKNRFALKANISINQKENRYAFRENLLELNALALQFDGWVMLKDSSTVMDVSFKSNKQEFKYLLSLVPGIFKKDFESWNIRGTLSKCEGSAKGSLSESVIPSFNLELGVKNAGFSYPEQKVEVSDLNFDLRVENKGSKLNNTVVQIPNFRLRIDQVPVNGSFYLSNPVTDPYIDAKLKGKVDLGKLIAVFPVEGIRKLDGEIDADLAVKTKMSYVEKKNYEKVNASGKLDLSNVSYEGTATPQPLKITSLLLQFNPDKISMPVCNLSLGKTSLSAKGNLESFIPYLFSNGELKAEVSLQSPNIDLAEFSSEPGTTSTNNAESTSSGLPQLPERIDLSANATIQKLKLNEIILTDVTGTLLLKDGILDLNGLHANTLGGSMNLNGKYKPDGSESATLDFHYSLSQLVVEQAVKSIPALEKLSPIAKYTQGIFSGSVDLSTGIKKDFSPDYNSLTGNAIVKMDVAKLVNVPALNQMAQLSKLEALKNPELRNIWTELKFTDGRVFIEKPVELAFKEIKMILTGSGGFDKSMNYKVAVDVPSSKLGNAQTVANDLLRKSPIPGLQGLPEVITFNFLVGGTVEQPKVSLGAPGVGGKPLANQLADQAKKELESKADDLKKQAEAEVNKQVEQAKKEAEKKAEELRKQAEQKAKDELERAKRDLGKKLNLPW